MMTPNTVANGPSWIPMPDDKAYKLLMSSEMFMNPSLPTILTTSCRTLVSENGFGLRNLKYVDRTTVVSHRLMQHITDETIK